MVVDVDLVEEEVVVDLVAEVEVVSAVDVVEDVVVVDLVDPNATILVLPKKSLVSSSVPLLILILITIHSTKPSYHILSLHIL